MMHRLSMREDRPRKPTGSRTPSRFSPQRPPARPAPRPGKDRSQGGTSWEKSADWYDRILGEKGSLVLVDERVVGILPLAAPLLLSAGKHQVAHGPRR